MNSNEETNSDHHSISPQRLSKENQHLLKSLQPYGQTLLSQTPMEQQYERSHWNLITICIAIFILLSITIRMYQIFSSTILQFNQTEIKQS